MSTLDRQESSPGRNPSGWLIALRVFLVLGALPSAILWIISLLAG